jgi:hypothetical protein
VRLLNSQHPRCVFGLSAEFLPKRPKTIRNYEARGPSLLKPLESAALVLNLNIDSEALFLA